MLEYHCAVGHSPGPERHGWLYQPLLTYPQEIIGYGYYGIPFSTVESEVPSARHKEGTIEHAMDHGASLICGSGLAAGDTLNVHHVSLPSE